MTTPRVETIKPSGDDGPRFYRVGDSDELLPGVTSVLAIYSPDGGAGKAGAAAYSVAASAVHLIRSGDALDMSGRTLIDLINSDPQQAYLMLGKSLNDRRDAQGARGNDAHDTLERVAFMSVDEMRAAYVDAAQHQDDPFALNLWALSAWAAFVKKYNVIVLYSEVTVLSSHGYMGTTDAIVEMDTPWLDGITRGVVIIDTKTGHIKEETVTKQLAAYRYADEMITADGSGDQVLAPMPRIDGSAVFRPREDGLFDFVPVDADEDEFADFLALLRLFNRAQIKKSIKALDGRKTLPSRKNDWGLNG